MMVKLTADHPGFIVTRARIDKTVAAAADKFRLEIVRRVPPMARFQVGFAADVEFQVSAALKKLRKRLERQSGLTGKYVAH